MIKYTFIIPHKNNPELLIRCINSIPERNDIQIVVVDDNSRPDSLPRIEREGVEVILIDSNSSNGAGHARNVGMKRAKGDWLLFADCDDFYVPNFIKVLDEYANSKIDVLYFNFNHLDGITGESLPDLPFAKFFNQFDGSERIVNEIRYHHNVPWTKMVKRSFIEKNNIYFEEVVNGNDILFSLQVGFLLKTFVVEKRKVYNYLRNNNSILTKTPSIQESICRIIHNIKLNHVYTRIGHIEWHISTMSLIKSKYDNNHKGKYMAFLFRLLLLAPKLLIKREEWADYLVKKPTMSNYSEIL